MDTEQIERHGTLRQDIKELEVIFCILTFVQILSAHFNAKRQNVIIRALMGLMKFFSQNKGIIIAVILALVAIYYRAKI